MAEIGTRIEAVVAAGTQHEPAGVGAPVVERLGVVRVGCGHRTCGSPPYGPRGGFITLAGTSVPIGGRQGDYPQVGLMVPDAELSVVGERVAKETTVVGWTGEGDRLLLGRGIDDDVNLVAEAAGLGVEVDAAEIVADGVEPHPRPLPVEGRGKGTGRTEIERTAIGGEDGEGLIDGVLLEQGRQQQLVVVDVVDQKVGSGIKDLDAVGVGTMEQLTCGIGGMAT